MKNGIKKSFTVFLLAFSLVFSFVPNISLAQVDFDQNLGAAKSWADNKFPLPTELTNDEKTQIVRYTGSTYGPINEYLLNNSGLGSDNKLNNQINLITSGISKSHAPDDLVLYRRVTEQQFGYSYGDLRDPAGNGSINKENYQKIKDSFEGKIITHHNFMSTSLARDPHKSFGDRQAVLLKVKAPKGTEIMNVSGISKYPDQLELLVNRNYKISYDKFSIVSSGLKEYVQVDVRILGKSS
ncbi:TPA: ADP-ribosyltransferase [Staphylococcus aureus]|nr:ADP-ribosyltransferase [Staphylococcus aureus]